MELYSVLILLVAGSASYTNGIEPRKIFFQCDYETTTCGASYDWIKRTGSTPTPNTGPSTDATGIASRSYLYHEANIRPVGVVFYLIPIDSINGFCVEFYYHMYGVGMGKLNVELMNQQGIKKVLQLSGNQGNIWHKFNRTFIHTSGNVMLKFTAERGSSLESDIAIDEIKVASSCSVKTTQQTTTPSPTDSSQTTKATIQTTKRPFETTKSPHETTGTHTTTPSTSSSVTTTATTTLPVDTTQQSTTGSPSGTSQTPFETTTRASQTTVRPFETTRRPFETTRSPNETTGTHTTTPSTSSSVIFKCDFERDACNSSITSSKNWLRWSGRTPSSNTGPSTDATGSSLRYYLYYETSGGLFGSQALLHYRLSANSLSYCVEFSYHMYGSDMGRFEVYFTPESGLPRQLLTVSGNQGDQWRKARLTALNSNFPRASYVTLAFVATRGTSYMSDIAIDEIVVRTDRCTGPMAGLHFSRTPAPTQNMFTSHFSHSTEYGFVSIELKEPQTSVLSVINIDIRSQTNHGSYFSSLVAFTRMPSFLISQNMYILEGTPTTNIFQYGNLTIGNVISGTKCATHQFEKPFSSKPVVKITAGVFHSQRLPSQELVNAWLKSVSVTNFTVCTKEMIDFSGSRDVIINFVAASQTSDLLKEIHHIKIPKGDIQPNTTCIEKQLSNIFIDPPYVFTSVESPSEPAISWTKGISQSKVEICIAMSHATDTEIHLIVDGNISPCTNVSCPDHLECQVNKTNAKAFCGCIQRCDVHQEFCGSDRQTYDSFCRMNQLHCWRNGAESKSNVTIQHYGKCQVPTIQSGRTQLEANKEMPGLFCKYINIDPTNFINSQSSTLKVLLTSSLNQTSNNMKEASAAWSEDVTINGFKACIMVAGRHLHSEFDYPPSVHWTVFQKEYSPGKYSGSVMLDTWYTGTQCKEAMTINYLTDSIGEGNVFASAHHLEARNLQNAMTVWAEKTRRSSNYVSIRVCARELQNFDGVHKGVVIHWLYVPRKPLMPPHTSEHLYAEFPAMTITLGQENPVDCQNFTYNTRFPSLPNPAVIIGAVNTNIPYSYVYTASVYSQHDVAVWIEKIDRAKLTICLKSLRSSISRPLLKIGILVFPNLCPNGGSFRNGTCYHSMPNCASFSAAKAECQNKFGASLPIINNALQSTSVEERITGPSWLDLTKSSTGVWKWGDSTSLGFTKWYPGQPGSIPGHNCAVVNNTDGKNGWKVEDCTECKNVVCQKVEEVEGCSNYTMHNESWRNVHHNSTIQSNETSCDARFLTTGWHRFGGEAGTQLYNGCPAPGSCGTRSPGYLSQNVSIPLGDSRPVRIYFRTFYCGDDYGTVVITNCARFYTYKFLPISSIPYWSCNYGVCTI
uniref:Uncharacterized protein n=1 Tax=Clytia hemisphaerica TaxID=252671 RepID=A0A7M5WI73_9CNID